MNRFLDRVVEYVNSVEGINRLKLCVVFPTRRACLIFRDRLAGASGKTTWSPSIMSIGDFLAAHTQQRIINGAELLLELYPVYKKHWPQTDYSTYYPWGKMLITDFNDIDKQLVDPDKLFTGIRDLRSIEALFLPDSEELQWLKDFSASLNEKELSKLQSGFMQTWDKLPKIYNDLNAVLSGKGLTYEGMAYRTLCRELSSKKAKLSHDHFVFAGFYGLSRSEEKMISDLKEMHPVQVFWDTDSYYMNYKHMEAGRYFRRSPLVKVEPPKSSDNILSKEKAITITGVPQKTGMARFAGSILKEIPDAFTSDTAIILPDESLLPMVLNSIPESSGDINVTMGYPMDGTAVYSFVKYLYNLHRHGKKGSGDSVRFYHRYVHDILSQPVAGSLVNNFAGQHDHLFMSAAQIKEKYSFGQAEILFKDITAPDDVITYMIMVLEYIADADNKGLSGRLNKLCLESAYSEIKKLQDLIKPYLSDIDVNTAWQMVIEAIRSLRIPLSGEPVKGLQIMGFLETRTLDFKNLIILSMNESALPGSKHSHSYIPFSLRKAWGIPTRDESDSTYAYHFYRLLHQAENVHYVYDTSAGTKPGGEVSRYLLQIEHELANNTGNKSNIVQQFLNFKMPVEKDQAITIPKTEKIVNKLIQRFGADGNEYHFLSPSALSSYINCKLQFYLKYVAKIKEQEEFEDEIDSAKFGSILHHVMEQLYHPFEGKTLNASDIAAMIPLIGNHVNKAVEHVLKTRREQLTGNNMLQVGAVEIFVKRLLERDIQDEAIEIIALEKAFLTEKKINGSTIKVGGKFDRVDKVNHTTRIIDYKTGYISLSSPIDLDKIFTLPEKKSLFQLYFYNYIHQKLHSDQTSVAGFYQIKQVASGIQFPKVKETEYEALIIDFGERLDKLIAEIFDTDVPFSKTSELANCTYCPYKDICHR